MIYVYLTLFALVHAHAHADADAEETIRLETLEIQGSRSGRRYSASPESVSVFRATDLPATGRQNSLQILNAVPNVEVNKNGESFSIRGINSAGVTGFQKDNLSSILIDDFWQTDLALQAGSFQLWDLEHLEVLRGAQSTNLGVNSLAGSILLYSNRPVFGEERAARVGLGNFSHREAAVTANHSLLGNRLAIRGTYQKETDDGYITNLTTRNDRWGRWNRDRASIGLRYELTPLDAFSLTGKLHRNHQGGTYVQGADAFRREVTEDQDFAALTENYQLLANYTRTFSDSLKDTLLIGTSRSFQDQSSDADGTAAPLAGVRKENHDDQYWSIENQIRWRTRFTTHLFGLHTHRYRLGDGYDFDLLYPVGTAVTPVSIDQSVVRSRRVYSLFDQSTIRLTEKQSIALGVRGEFTQSRYGTFVAGERLQNLGPANNARLDAYLDSVRGSYSGKQSNFVVLPKLGYLFESGRHHAGLTYTRGYRTAGLSINRRRAAAVEYDAEFTNNYEASYKFIDDQRAWSVNLFHVDWRAQQVLVQVSPDFFDTQVENAAKSSVNGAELETKWELTPDQQLQLGVGYSTTKFREFALNGQDYRGKQFPFAPHITSRLAYDARASDRLRFLTVLRSVSGSFTNADNSRRGDAQTYLDLNAQYDFPTGWVLEAYLNNVLNRNFRTFDGSPSSNTATYSGSYHQVSTPRELGGRLSYFW